MRVKSMCVMSTMGRKFAQLINEHARPLCGQKDDEDGDEDEDEQDDDDDDEDDEAEAVANAAFEAAVAGGRAVGGVAGADEDDDNDVDEDEEDDGVRMSCPSPCQLGGDRDLWNTRCCVV